MRAKAVAAVLCSQPERKTLKLSEQVLLLDALVQGRFDHLADARPGEIWSQTQNLLEHMKVHAAQELSLIDTSQVRALKNI